MERSKTRMQDAPHDRLTGSIGVGHIVFFVVAAAAPLTSVVGASPAAFAFGNGAGVPGTYLVAGLLYLLFSVGFTAMSTRIDSTGGFFQYITLGLGGRMGAAGAMVSIATYSAIQLSILALAGVYLGDVAGPLGLALPWWAWAGAIIGVVMLVGRRHVELSGNILGVCMLAEIAILLLLDLGCLLHAGPHGIGLDAFAPNIVLGKGLGVSMVFVIGSFMGFEATALFAEEARDAKTSIPRATYLAVGAIMAFYAFSTWSITQYYGPDRVTAIAAAGLDTFYFRATEEVLGGWATAVMRALLILSLFACALSLHSSINRYLLALAREGLLSRSLSRVNPAHGAPVAAGKVQGAMAVALVVGAALLRPDPYAVVFGWASAFAVMGILAVQIVVCIAIVRFFRNVPDCPSRWVGLVAPTLAGLGLAVCLACVIANLPLLAGSDSPALHIFPAVLVLIGLAGAWRAHARRRDRPGRDATLRLLGDET
ncbi:APC family permease [Sphingobium sp. H39-3-25]|uniref:Amino acid permease-associated protein n=1 Tax=Sphingopyxis fribergensis TaxID=1515612 RepID=A0A0A7PDH2_9SPHN|nr:APC family permease [Sphingopyxis fribergensis]AJA07233.1 amino acid permease-associated protein [Sphingopyxis fribergensis]MDF0545567.1 APC family permease [Sphingobium arseniciresistens]